MILSAAELLRRIISDQSAKPWWSKDQWDVIDQHVLIWPFDPERLGILGYEIAVGEEYLSLRNPDDTRRLDPAQPFEVGPGETVLILSEEFIALPKSVMGLVVPKARRIFEGGLINATRIDPTWYGKLIVGFTNLAKYPTALRRGDTFCECLFLETEEVGKTLRDLRTEGLGREHLVVEFPNLRHRHPRRPDTVTIDDLHRVVEEHGPPFDILVGGFHQTRLELLHQVERDVGPNIVRQAVSEAKTSAWNWFFGLLTVLIAGVLTAVGTIVYLIFRK